MWFLFTLAVIVLLFLFPRPMAVVLGIGVVVGAAFGVWYYLQQQDLKQQEAQVEIDVHYNPAHCSPEQPLLVTITNAASRAVVGAEWVLSARRPGYRSELTGDWLKTYRSDEAIAAGQTWSKCYAAPQRREHAVQRAGDDPARLQIGIRSRSIRFAE